MIGKHPRRPVTFKPKAGGRPVTRGLVLLLLVVGCDSRVRDTTVAFERVSPEDAGYSRDALKAVDTHLEQIGSAALLALHDGKLFWSWGAVDEKYPVHSMRKALVSALYGIQVERGVIDLDRTLAELGIDDTPSALTDEEKQATVRDLIESRSGVYIPAAAEAPSMIQQRPERGSHPPGTHFYYNNWDFNVAGAILEQATDESLFATFERDIARPLGMRFTADDGQHVYETDRSSYPAYPFWMSTVDLARFGLLYQRGGTWDGKQIVPEGWIEESTRTRSVFSEELNVGYGMMWYTTLEDEGHGYPFFHTGAGVHVLAIFPDLDLVWVHRVNTERDYATTSQDLIRLWRMVLDARKQPVAGS